MAIEPPPSVWTFPDPQYAHPAGLVAAGGDLAPGTLLAAYRSGLFPMPGDVAGEIHWWSPDPRGVIELDRFHASRSLHRSRRTFDVRVDTRFRQVVTTCSQLDRPGAWITPSIVDAYCHLHELGWAHSIEVLSADGSLVGGLYGVGIGGFFAGESMFHLATDASKVAVWGLVEILSAGGASLFDVQWTTDHLHSLGAGDVPRSRYLQRLAEAVAMPVDPFTHT